MAIKSSAPAWTSAAARRIVEAAGDGLSVEEAVARVCTGLRRGVAESPTNLDQIASRLGVASVKSESLPVTGELRKTDRGLEITYASGLPVGRRRFTIAHELGHAYFESLGRSAPRRGKELERICDMVAVELLMPADVILRDFPQVSPLSIFDITMRFRVSFSAAMYRMSYLWGIHVAMDTGSSRIATLGALRSGDSAVWSTVNEARTDGTSESMVTLSRNQVWNGAWRVRAAQAESGYVVIATVEPMSIDGRPILKARMETSSPHSPQLTHRVRS